MLLFMGLLVKFTPLDLLEISPILAPNSVPQRPPSRPQAGPPASQIYLPTKSHKTPPMLPNISLYQSLPPALPCTPALWPITQLVATLATELTTPSCSARPPLLSARYRSRLTPWPHGQHNNTGLELPFLDGVFAGLLHLASFLGSALSALTVTKQRPVVETACSIFTIRWDTPVCVF